jgi:hypothetical protein
MLLKMSEVLNLRVAVDISLLPMAVQQSPAQRQTRPPSPQGVFILQLALMQVNKLR